MKHYGREPIDRRRIHVPSGRIYLIPDRCKGCGICIDFCPNHVLRESPTTNCKGYHVPELAPGKESACVNCEFCSLVCPEFAIFTTELVA